MCECRSPVGEGGRSECNEDRPGEGLLVEVRPLTRSLATLGTTLSRKGRGFPSVSNAQGITPPRLAAKRLADPPPKGREKKKSALRGRNGGNPGALRNAGVAARDGSRQQLRHAALAHIAQ